MFGLDRVTIRKELREVDLTYLELKNGVKHLAVSVILLVTSVGFGQEVPGMENALRILRVTGSQTEGVQIRTVPGEIFNTVFAPDASVTLNRTGAVVGWSRESMDEDPRDVTGRSLAVSSTAQAWEVAEQWLDRVVGSAHPRDEASERRSSGGIYGYHLRFTERPYGFEGGTANSMLVTVNAYTGEVIEWNQVVGITYDAPNIRVSEENAVSIAERRCREVYSASIESIRSEVLIYVGDGEGELADPFRPRLDQERKARLAYRVRVALGADGRTYEGTAFVDAETGLILEGGVSKGSKPSATKPSSAQSAPTEVPKTTPKSLPIVIGASGLLAIGWLVRNLLRRR